VKSLGQRATRLVYPLEALAKPGPHPTYPRGDSHWSDYGAMLALSQVEPIALPGPEEYKTEYRNADLLSKLGGVCVEPMPVLKRGFSTKLVGDNKVVNTGRRRDFRSGLEAAKGRLLMSHDSFGEWLIQPLAERYAETTAIWSPALERAVLEQVNPTTILFERAERFLTSPARMS
jgi:hypothetical protein